MNRPSGLSSPFLLGFEEIERALERLTKTSGDGYPPYNIERLPKSASQQETLRITLAVAGFGRDDLEVTVEENQLVIRGRQSESSDRMFLHRGIAARQFQKTFPLAEGIEVLSADLNHGLLAIDLVRPTMVRVVRRIKISGQAERSGPEE